MKKISEAVALAALGFASLTFSGGCGEYSGGYVERDEYYIPNRVYVAPQYKHYNSQRHIAVPHHIVPHRSAPHFSSPSHSSHHR